MERYALDDSGIRHDDKQHLTVPREMSPSLADTSPSRWPPAVLLGGQCPPTGSVGYEDCPLSRGNRRLLCGYLKLGCSLVNSSEGRFPFCDSDRGLCPVEAVGWEGK